MSKSSSLNIIQATPDLVHNKAKLAQVIRDNMTDPGYVVVRGFDMGSAQVQEASDFLLELGHLLGTPVSHDESGSLIWDIKASGRTGSKVPTFSEHADEAFLHTDSQYRQNPEDVFALYCLQPAADGGGVSLLMTYQDLMDEMHATPENKALIPHLETALYPFAVPTAFKLTPDGPPEYVYSPILEGNGQLRFRVDTLISALADGIGDLSDDALAAFEMVKGILETSDKVRAFDLETGDLFFLNNRRTLHGRTSFTDVNRHLLRIRLACENV